MELHDSVSASGTTISFKVVSTDYIYETFRVGLVGALNDIQHRAAEQ